MQYEEMSDYEINRAVAAYHIPCSYEPYEEFERVRRISLDSDCEVIVGDIFDPCNNPSDAWPIITGSKIDLRFDYDEVNHCTAFHGLLTNYHHKNPLRAAMIVYLMMKDAENE